MAKGYYKCECGKEFYNPQSFNGHKSRCIIHHKIKNNYDNWSHNNKVMRQKGVATQKKNLNIIRESIINIWISEKHECERCGKIMTEKFGSGRFCSKSCANKKEHSNATKIKISKSLQLYNNTAQVKEKRSDNHNSSIQKSMERYNKSPKKCCICGKPISYELRGRKTCSNECLKTIQSLSIQKTRRKIGMFNVCSKYKYGTYHGIHCDSSWELAFVIYLIDNGVNFERNTTESFPYIYNGVRCLFYPDFIIDGVYYEIKGFPTERLTAKINYFPKTKKIVVLYKEDIKPYIKYATDKYGKKFYTLYDKDSPSWMGDNI